MSRCPTLEVLQRLIDEELEGEAGRSVSRHVAACTACQGVLEQLTADPVSSVRTAIPVTAGDESRTAFLQRMKSKRPSGHSWAGLTPRVGRGRTELPAVPDYEVLRELGRGGMGVVYLARQAGLNRLVALKMLRSGGDAPASERERFAREAEAVARLRHPHIVHVYDVGEVDGVPYLALEHIEGGSLADRLHGDPQPLLPAARLVETLARAVHAAHQAGIIHRDLKPSNVLLQMDSPADRLSPPPGTLPTFNLQSAVPKVTDFGLAKRLDDPHTRTGTGDIVGTPSYMAPEQAASIGPPVGPRADVYALGAILYELITGRPPFKGATPVDTVVMLLHQEPVRPGSLRPDLPRDLETICLACLNKDPNRRYPSAEALADDLARFRQGRPITARPVGPVERAVKWSRRRPLTAALIAAILLLGMTSFAGVTYLWQKAEVARDRLAYEKRQKEIEKEEAEKARAETAEQRRQARQLLYGSRISQSQLLWRVNDVVAAREALERCYPSPGQEDRRGWEWHYLRRLYQSHQSRLGHKQSGGGGAVTFSRRGGRLASIVASPELDNSQEGELRTWDAGGKPLLVKAVPGTMQRLAFSPDGTRLALAGADGDVMVVEATTGRELLRWKADRLDILGIAFSPDGKLLATGSWAQAIRTWDADTGKLVRTFDPGHTDKVQDLSFDPTGQRLASAGWDGTARVWDVNTGKLLHTLSDHKAPIYCVVHSPDGRLLATASQNGNVKIWDRATGRAVQSVTGLAGAVLNLSFSPDSRYIAYGGGDATVRVWDIESGNDHAIFRGHTMPVECVDFSPDGQRLASCSPRDGTVLVWDTTQHAESATFARLGADVEAVAFRGGELLSVTASGTLQSWDRATGVLLTEQTVPMRSQGTGPNVVTSFAPDGSRLAARGREDGQLRVWDTRTGAAVLTIRAHDALVECARFSPDGKYLATAGTDRPGPRARCEVRVWDAATGERLASLTPPGRVISLAFRPGGGWLAWGGVDGLLGMAHWPTGRPGPEMKPHRGTVSALTFHPNGQQLASVGQDDRTVRVQLLEDGGDGEVTLGPVRRMGSPRQVCELAFSPDGQRLAGITRDLVKVWSPETRLEMLTLRGASQRYWDAPFTPRLLFSPGGGGLCGTNWDESISLWEAGTGDEAGRPDRRRLADERAAFWHLQEAELCLQHRNVTAARFHLKRLEAARLPPPLRSRKERLVQALEKAQTGP